MIFRNFFAEHEEGAGAPTHTERVRTPDRSMVERKERPRPQSRSPRIVVGVTMLVHRTSPPSEGGPPPTCFNRYPRAGESQTSQKRESRGPYTVSVCKGPGPSRKGATRHKRLAHVSATLRHTRGGGLLVGEGERDAGREGRTALRCVCGHALLCEVRSAGEGIGFLVCFDDEPTSETRGQQVKSCPSCDERLRLAWR